jgi:methyl-accepting chemotaxis protein
MDQTLEVYEDAADAAESAVNVVSETVNQTIEEVAVTVEKAVEDVGQALQDVAESVSEAVDATSQYVSESMDVAYNNACTVFADLVAFTTLAARLMDQELSATRRRLAWAGDFLVRSWQKNLADSRTWTNRANRQFWCAVRDVGGRMWRPFRRAPVNC